MFGALQNLVSRAVGGSNSGGGGGGTAGGAAGGGQQHDGSSSNTTNQTGNAGGGGGAQGGGQQANYNQGGGIGGSPNGGGMFGGAVNGGFNMGGGGDGGNNSGIAGLDSTRKEIAGIGTTRRQYAGPEGKLIEIREVWAENLDEEMAIIREVVEKYPYVAMDTEFPGVVTRPVGDVTAQDYQYKTLKCNVDLLKIIQLGLSFADEQGKSVEPCPTWQFNFRFSLNDDIYAEDSIELLKSSGIDFAKHEAHGIDVFRFGEQLMTSGLVLMDNVRWISFHSGYDFGYLLKILTCRALPSDESSFFELLRTYFPCFYDIKYLMTACQGLHGGLQKIAEELSVARIGPMHQAGSDSLLTAQTFFRLCAVSFNGLSNLNEDKFKGELFGLGHNHTVFRPKMNGGLPAPRGGNTQRDTQGGGGDKAGGGDRPGFDRLESLSSSTASRSGGIDSSTAGTVNAVPPSSTAATTNILSGSPQGGGTTAQEDAAVGFLLLEQYNNAGGK